MLRRQKLNDILELIDDRNLDSLGFQEVIDESR